MRIIGNLQEKEHVQLAGIFDQPDVVAAPRKND